jgi:succinate-semialdehyde dehydrogenase/glutarate-semialdehyde dehydrogenase
MALRSINPYTNILIGEYEEFTGRQIDDCIAQAAGAFESWRKTTFRYRQELMLKVAAQLQENVEMLAQTATSEMGKTITEARAEVKKCAWVCEHYANDAEVLLQREAVATDAHFASVRYEPLGTILGIMPWNYPFWQVFRFVAPTLMAGNVVLLKHASNVQLCARAIENLFGKAGFPSGVFQNLVMGSARIGQVIANDVIKAVTLTGSEPAGKSVAEAAGRNIKKTVLELGGSDAFIVLDDADIEKAAETGVRSRMQNAGQSCIAAKRFIVHQKVYGSFVKLYEEKVRSLVTGNPLDNATQLGPLSGMRQAETVKEQLERSVNAGAEILTGGYPEKAMFPPTLVTSVVPGMPLFDEEVFGPVAPLILAKDTTEAVALANRSDFGLGLTLFTNDLDRAEELIPDLYAGAVFVNSMVKSDPRLPFGGIKHSGYGRELSVHGIREFVNVKTVSIDKLHDTETPEGKNIVISTGRT